MTYSKKLWLRLGGIFIVSFAILGLIGREIYVPGPGRAIERRGASLPHQIPERLGLRQHSAVIGVLEGAAGAHGHAGQRILGDRYREARRE